MATWRKCPKCGHQMFVEVETCDWCGWSVFTDDKSGGSADVVRAPAERPRRSLAERIGLKKTGK